jgi:hypothetical protein
MIRFVRVDKVGQNSARVQFIPNSEYWERYFGIYLNGVLEEIVYAHAWSVTEVVLALEPTETKAYIYIEDFGDWASVTEDDDPDEMALAREEEQGDRLSYTWTHPTTFSTTNKFCTVGRGDSQLSAISVTGMKRFTNCMEVQDCPNRGRLMYTIHNDSGTYTVRFWKGARLVAEGSRSGNGAITCNAINSSGITVAATLTFTAEVDPGIAYITLKWPESYQVHYSTSALSFPRSPEMTALDVGNDKFAVRTPSLAAGTYNAAVVPVLDGVAQTAGVTVDSGIGS